MGVRANQRAHDPSELTIKLRNVSNSYTAAAVHRVRPEEDVVGSLRGVVGLQMRNVRVADDGKS